MSNQPGKISKFIIEFKRRKVTRVVIVYASTAFILSQVVDILANSLNLPSWVMPLLIVLLAVGFPIALILTWAYHITPDSKQETILKVKDDEIKLMPLKTDIKEKSILVLPFDNISSDSEQEYFSDGLTEEIITDLSYIEDLLVISRSSAMTFKGTKQTIKEIADKVNVKYVLEGSVRKSNNKIRITAQLIDAQNDIHLWAKKYDGETGDIFDIQEKVSGAIASELKVKLNKQQPTGLNIDDIGIFEAYYRALNNIFHFDEEATTGAINDLNKALLEFGNHPLLQTIKAWGMWSLVTLGFKSLDYLSEAEEILKSSIRSKPDFPRTYSILGWVNIHIDYKESIKYFNRALQLDENEPFALQGIVVLYSSMGKTDAAIVYLNRLQQIDPLNYLTRWLRGGVHFYHGNFKEAFYEWDNQYKNQLHLASSSFFAALSMIYFESESSVIEYITDKIDQTSQQSYDKLLRMLDYLLQGDINSFRKEMDEKFILICKKDFTYAHHLAAFFALLNKKKEALYWLEIAINEGFINYPMISEKDILLDNIRGEREFAELLAKARHEWENFEA